MLYQLIQYIGIVSILPGAILAAINYKRLHIKALRILAMLAFYNVVWELISMITSIGFVVNNSMLVGIHSSGELLLIALYFTQSLTTKQFRPLFISVSIILTIAMAANLCFEPGIFPAKARAAQALAIVIFSIYGFFVWLKSYDQRIYELYVILAFLIYFSACTITFYYSDVMPPDWARIIWFFHDIVNIASNLLILFAFINYLYRHGKKL
ncbi:MAG: hypothetical protein P0Y49_09190 [Candidatus Pedobacter colombiensis]|uniref:Uncharacterized protein n=1 Tax=Candidatus Pedobacter colombiensis TaxID=3121371 RepID=A0AAJ5WD70_9SPHI|nr:hypothetical protein [Pedobacter sp.]WEK21314.1 MAG: hypothetical protein P0Y49_09190 [Pedobacter sp.]